MSINGIENIESLNIVCTGSSSCRSMNSINMTKLTEIDNNIDYSTNIDCSGSYSCQYSNYYK